MCRLGQPLRRDLEHCPAAKVIGATVIAAHTRGAVKIAGSVKDEVGDGSGAVEAVVVEGVGNFLRPFPALGGRQLEHRTAAVAGITAQNATLVSRAIEVTGGIED